MIQSLVPDSQKLQQQLNSLAEFTECDELVLFERNTFLVLANSDNSLSLDPFRFEKINKRTKNKRTAKTTKRRKPLTCFGIGFFPSYKAAP